MSAMPKTAVGCGGLIVLCIFVFVACVGLVLCSVTILGHYAARQQREALAKEEKADHDKKAKAKATRDALPRKGKDDKAVQ